LQEAATVEKPPNGIMNFILAHLSLLPLAAPRPVLPWGRS
jgi:hypothetical protein